MGVDRFRAARDYADRTRERGCGEGQSRPVEAYGGAVTLSESQRQILGIEFDARRGRLASTQCAAGTLHWAKKQSGRVRPATSFHIPRHTHCQNLAVFRFDRFSLVLLKKFSILQHGV